MYNHPPKDFKVTGLLIVFIIPILKNIKRREFFHWCFASFFHILGVLILWKFRDKKQPFLLWMVYVYVEEKQVKPFNYIWIVVIK